MIFFNTKFLQMSVKSFIIVCLYLFLTLPLIYGDGAYITFQGEIQAYEPSQSAVIGWNGNEEVLLLSTNVRTNSATSSWAIELIPFPSLPRQPVAGTLESIQLLSEYIATQMGRIEIGDVNLDSSINIVDALMMAQYYVGLKPGGFYKFTGDVDGSGRIDIIDALIVAQYYVGLLNGFSSGSIDEINVSFKTQIGVHNITVVETENADQLITFAEQTLSEVTTTDDVQWGDFTEIAADYIEQGMNYWVIDLLDLDSTEKSRDPLIYRFETPYLYFPLKVSSVNSGRTLIDIITISINRLDGQAIEAAGLEGIPFNKYYDISIPDLIDISPEIVDLFAAISSPLKIGRHFYQGYLSDLSKDLIAQEIE